MARPGPYAVRRTALLRDATTWFGPGQDRRTYARRARRCVECWAPLTSSRTPYCSRKCQWSFHGRFFWDSARRVVLRRDRYTCRACGIRQRTRFLDVDHIVPISEGGAPLEYANLQTLCRPCHRAKTADARRRPPTGRRAPEYPDPLPHPEPPTPWDPDDDEDDESPGWFAA